MTANSPKTEFKLSNRIYTNWDDSVEPQMSESDYDTTKLPDWPRQATRPTKRATIVMAFCQCF